MFKDMTYEEELRGMQRIKGTYGKIKETFVHFARVLLAGERPKTEAIRTNRSQKPKKQSQKKPNADRSQKSTRTKTQQKRKNVTPTLRPPNETVSAVALSAVAL